MFSKKIINNFKHISNVFSNHKDIKHITQVNTQLQPFNNIRWTKNPSLKLEDVRLTSKKTVFLLAYRSFLSIPSNLCGN